MMLLQCAFTDYADIFIGSATLALAFFSFRSGLKIDKLATINEQLINQTAIFSKQLELERLSTIQTRIPYFLEIGPLHKYETRGLHEITIINRGQLAREINVIGPDEYVIENSKKPHCGNRMDIKFSINIPIGKFNNPYSLKLEYLNDFNSLQYQDINVNPNENKFSLTLPKDIL